MEEDDGWFFNLGSQKYLLNSNYFLTFPLLYRYVKLYIKVLKQVMFKAKNGTHPTAKIS